MEQTLEKQQTAFQHETRLYNDVTTWLSETLEGSMRTPFCYTFDGTELYAGDGGALKPIFEDALADAERYPKELFFEYRRRLHERREYDDMIAMMKGELPNTMVVISDFPSELQSANYDVGGYDVSRKQTMLRVISKDDNGTLTMQSQSLDLSDRTALEEMYHFFGLEPRYGELLGQRIHIDLQGCEQEFLIDRLMSVYDASLSNQYGGSWYAGRRTGPTINTYDFVRAQHDLVHLYTQAARSFGEHPEFLRDIAAAIRVRYEQYLDNGHTDALQCVPHDMMVSRDLLLKEIIEAGKMASQEGRVFSGCGITLGFEATTVGSEMASLGFGNKSGEDKYGSLTFKCPKGHTNRRPRNKLIPKCTTCGTSVAC